MAHQKIRLLSGRVAVTNASSVTADRYNFLDLSSAEPNLGIAPANSILTFSSTSSTGRAWSSFDGLYTTSNVSPYVQAAYAQANTNSGTTALAQAAFNQANAANILASSAYSSANANIIYLLAISQAQNANVSGINTYSTSAYAYANSLNTFVSSAYSQANNATGANALAQAAFDRANAANILASSAYANSNSVSIYSISSYNSSNAVSTYSISAYNSSNAVSTYSTSAYNYANNVNTFAQAAFAQANTQVGSGNLAQAAFDRANSANVLAQSSYNFANAVSTYSQSAYSTANGISAYATSSYSTANAVNLLAISAYSNSNSVSTYSQSAYTTANGANGLAQSAYNRANTYAGTFSNNSGYLANTVLVSNTTGFISVSSNIQFYNTNSTFITANVYATSAFIFPDGSIQTTSAVSASSNTVLLKGALDAANANIALLFAYSLASNANTSSLNTYSTSAYNYSNNVNSFTQSAYNSANSKASSTGYQANSFIYVNQAGTITTTSPIVYAASNTTTTITGTANVTSNVYIAGSLFVTGGFTDGTQVSITGNTIGGSTLSYSNIVRITNTTSSISNTTGALIVSGGVGVTGNIYTGNHYITGTGNGITFVDGTTQTTSFIGPLNTANANISYILTYGLAANANMSAINTYAASAYNKANTAGGGGVVITDDTTTNASRYPILSISTSGTASTGNTSSTKLYFNPSTGTLSSTIFNSLSDENQKTNIQLIPNGLQIVENLKGVTFDFIDGEVPSAGILAQDVEKWLPQLINNENGNKTLNYNGIIGVLVEAVKELSERVKALEKIK